MIGGALDGRDANAMLRSDASRTAGNFDLIAGLECLAVDVVARQENPRTPFNCPGLHHPILIRRHDVDEGMRIANQEIHHRTLDGDFFIDQISGWKCVVRERRRQARGCGNDYENPRKDAAAQHATPRGPKTAVSRMRALYTLVSMALALIPSSLPASSCDKPSSAVNSNGSISDLGSLAI